MSDRRTCSLGLSVAALLMVALAFGYQPGPNCEIDDECADGKACHFWEDPGTVPTAGAMGTCEEEGFGDACESTDQCQGELVCTAGFCSPPDIPAASPSLQGATSEESDGGTSDGEGCSVHRRDQSSFGTRISLLVTVAGALALRRRRNTRYRALC